MASLPSKRRNIRVRNSRPQGEWRVPLDVPPESSTSRCKRQHRQGYGSSLDIDERKTAEEQLRRNAEELQKSEFYLAEGQRLAHIGSWAFNPDGFYYWSPELFRIHGLDAANYEHCQEIDKSGHLLSSEKLTPIC
jgi:hypothetical protein